MIELGLYSIFDVKAKAFLAPFSIANDSMAVRSFGDAVNDPSVQFFKHPEDYTLYRVGTFNLEKGVLACDPTMIASGLSLKEVK